MSNIFLLQKPETRYVDRNTTVNEHRAPTDDSIRLYGEMMEKARSELVDAFKVDNNLIKGKVGLFRDCSRMGYIAVLKTDINGTKIETSIKLDDFNGNRQVLVEMLVKEISESITKELLMKCEELYHVI